MSNSPPNYTDGVPVKISEKFKPPPKIILPSSVAQKLLYLSSVEISHCNTGYDFNLEQNVLVKIGEWKNVRHKENNDRLDRKRVREQARMKQIEEEQKQQLNDVSYPSTDDLSSSEDEKNDKQTVSDPVKVYHHTHQLDTILMPTIVPGLDINNISYTLQTSTSQSSNYYNNQTLINKINFADFENDTSSPFDNMELKTINDLDILAQVLNNAVKIEENVNNNNNKEEPVMHVASTSTHAPTIDQQNSNVNYYQQYNNYNTYNTTNQSALPFNDNYVHNNYNHSNNLYQNNAVLGSTNYQNSNIYYNQNYACNFGYGANLNNSYVSDTNAVIFKADISNDQQKKVKSKSVPDIMRELNDEIEDSEMKRIRNNSQTISDDIKCEKVLNEDDNRFSQIIKDNEVYNKLSQSSQILVKRISSMGFSRDLVTRITQKFGNDDKKVSKYLFFIYEMVAF